MRDKFLRVSLICSLFSLRVFGASFVVPSDRDMVRRADAIVIGSPLNSYAQLTADGGIETVTSFAVTRVIKGTVLSATINLYEPGGSLGGRITQIPGVPRFSSGETSLLLLRQTGRDRWSVAELVVGKFRFAYDVAGRHLLLRDEDEIAGWDPDLKPHREQHRLATPFLEFIEAETKGLPTSSDYFVDAQPLQTDDSTVHASQAIAQPQPGVAAAGAFSATSYSMTISGNLGARWSVFPSAVTFFANAAGEPGAPGDGTTAVTAALAAWTNDPGSNVNYVYGGTDSTHTQGLHATDGANTVLFERDLSTWGVAPFSCSGSGYSGTLGIGGITSAAGTHALGGETFVTTQEADVEMNRGLANCSLLFNNGDFNSAVTHEVGHTLGFRHADQNRASNAACSTDATLECATTAIMKSFIPGGLNATLQPWDVNAVRAVYPGASSCTVPAITAQPQSTTINPGGSATLTVGATGTNLTYQWYIGPAGNASNPIPNSNAPSIRVTPSSATSYWVWITNSCGVVASSGATVFVGQCNPPVITAQSQSTTIAPGGSATLTVGATGTNLMYQWYIGPQGNASNPIPNSNAPSISVTPSSTTSYWVWITNSCGVVASSGATVFVGQCNPPAITAQPQSTTIAPGGSATLTVGATGTNLTYQWYIGPQGNASNPIPNSNAPSIRVTPSSTTSYWVWITNACGVVASSGATVFVGQCNPPAITAQPQSRTITRGSSTTITVGASGTTLNYQWYIGPAGNASNPVPNSNSPSITVAPSSTTSYWVWITNSCGVVASNNATVTVQ
jgi:uncharacterized cupredoxin-like copper-binding protein